MQSLQIQAPPGAFDAKAADRTLFAALLDAKATFGAETIILEDIERSPLTYGRLVLASLVMGDRLVARTSRGENVGVLLPNVNGMPITLFGLNAFGRTAALLNFTAGLKSLRAAIRAGEIKIIVTSRRFIANAKLDETIVALTKPGDDGTPAVAIVFLEDVRKEIGKLDQLKGLMRSWIARILHGRHALKADEPAVILFTSGTEGLPKGVVLSSRNLLANALQIGAHAQNALWRTDIVMNPLPMFHAFGLTAAALMPIMRGMRTVLYPSPLHYKEVPRLIRDTRATVLFATDTFMQGYARAAEPDDLVSIRVAICGAERVKEATRKAWAKWNAQILEGYGATECAPVIACNLPHNNTPGTVGALLPGLDASIAPVEGIAKGGKLSIRGPNVMMGYLRAEKPGVLERPTENWHDTGDIVEFDACGMIAIKGRAKRFAKIGGEMVSLSAVETLAADVWPEASHVVVALPDARKGEVLILVTDKADADRAALLAHAREQGLPELWVPRSIVPATQIPVLGSGKVDLPAATDIARNFMAGVR